MPSAQETAQAPTFEPPYIAPTRLAMALQSAGHAVVGPEGVCELLGVDQASLAALAPTWNDLPPDAYLRDGGRYRRRRHGCFIVEDGHVVPVPGRAHWQPLAYNALHGGLERWFEPLPEALLAQPAWPGLLCALAGICSALRGDQRWYVEAHQFRIDTTDGIGRPTPEGAHRDGVDFVAVVLVSRVGIKGGETRVFDATGPSGTRFTLGEPWTLMMLDDARVIHESTPIQPLVSGSEGHRDTLVLTFRSGAFQGPDSSAAS